LLKTAEKLSGWVVAQNSRIIAYAVGVAQAKGIQWQDLAGDADTLRGLVVHVHNLYPEAVGRMINLGEDDPAWRVLANLGYREMLSQWEMQLAL
jgi:hypothetical protein